MLLSQEKKRLERINAAYESGVDSLEEYRVKKAEIIARMQKLREKESESRNRQHLPPVTLQTTSDALFSLLETDHMTEDAKNTFLRSFISHIVFFRSEDAIQIHYHS